jgi:hypothetical protein
MTQPLPSARQLPTQHRPKNTANALYPASCSQPRGQSAFDAGIDASILAAGLQTILTRSSLPNACPIEVSARYACPCIKHVIGFPNSAGTRITAVALSWVQFRISGVSAAEQTKISAVSIIKLHALAKVETRAGTRIIRYCPASVQIEPSKNGADVSRPAPMSRFERTARARKARRVSHGRSDHHERRPRT